MRAFFVVLLVVTVAALAFYFGLAWNGPRAGERRPAAEVPAGAVENDPTARPRPSRPTAPLAGEWRSVDDPTFTRVFEKGGGFHDEYGGDPAGAPGTWAFAGDGTGTLTLSSEGDDMRFRVVALTDTTLQLVYLDGSGVQRYERVN